MMADISIPQFKVFMADEAPLYVEEVLRSGYIGQGPKVEEFEKKLQDKLGFKTAVTVNSCTSALTLALRLIGVGPGSEVISTPMTCLATNAAIAHTGASIVWADVDEYGNINPTDVYFKVTHKTKAVVAVDWAGVPADYNSLREALDRASLTDSRIPIIEDAAHAFGAEYDGRPISQSGGDYVCFSFQAIKHLTTGDGGLLVVPEEQYERAKLLRWYGLDRTISERMRCLQNVSEVGDKLHMNDIAASIGLANIKYVDDIVSKHRRNAEAFTDAFYRYGIVPPWPEKSKPSYWIYTVHVDKPSLFERYLAKHGIASSKVHNRNDIYTAFARSRINLRRLDSWFRTMTCIPVGWWLSDGDVEFIIKVVESYVRDTKI